MIPNEKHLLDLLSNNDVTFFIPPYQRNYEWGEDQCDVFYKDMIKVVHDNKAGNTSEHFFGTVTYFQKETAFGQPNKLVLIDGQQRITTTMLFLVALRDVLESPDIKRYIESKFLRNDNVADDSEYKIKLKQVETDWGIYVDIILGNNIHEKSKNSAVYRNYAYFTQKLKELSAANEFNLEEIIELGLSKFSVVTVELQPDRNPWENPQEIFESMNSLGKPLSLADLVRNYILLGIDPDEQEFLYKNYWLHMEEILPHIVTGYIRDYMQYSQGKAFKQATEKNYKELYSNFKTIFGKQDAKDLLKSLNECSDEYSCIVLGTPSGSEMIDHCLEDIRTLDVTTSYSFLMGLLVEWHDNKFLTSELYDILNVFIVYLVRRRIAGLTGAENKNFPALVRKIPELIKAEDKKSEMFNVLSSMENNLRLPNDIEIERALSTMNFYNFRYCKFVLSLVEERITKYRPDKDDSKIQIEHIMPQTLNPEWRIELGENADDIQQALLNNIGNLTLIRHNQELGNKVFSEKKVIYENNTSLQIARTHIIDFHKWNQDSIESRMKWIIDFIIQEVLPIPDERRKMNNFVMKHNKLSFLELQLIGQTINYISDKSIEVTVVNDHEVEFEGKKWRLSPLTKEIETRKGTVTPSGSYSGAQYWEYDGMRLSEVF